MEIRLLFSEAKHAVVRRDKTPLFPPHFLSRTDINSYIGKRQSPRNRTDSLLPVRARAVCKIRGLSVVRRCYAEGSSDCYTKL